jgi:hypothetical protein
MLGHSIVSQHFMEPEGLIPNSQELSPPVPILSYTNPVHITPSHLSKIQPNIIQPPTSYFADANQNYIEECGDVATCGSCKNQRSSQMSVLTTPTRRHNPEDGINYSHSCRILKSHKITLFPQLLVRTASTKFHVTSFRAGVTICLQTLSPLKSYTQFMRKHITAVLNIRKQCVRSVSTGLTIMLRDANADEKVFGGRLQSVCGPLQSSRKYLQI